MTSAHIKLSKELQRAVSAIRNARALFITCGAGMGVDSGLPDFRGSEGFWRAYPPLRKLGLQLEEMSNPSWFDNDPRFAWGFFGHRYNLYSQTTPHQGFDILHKWSKAMDQGYFVFTSNVDGHFQKAGYDSDRIVECHGTVHYMQCVDPSVDDTIWPVPVDSKFEVEADTLRLLGPLPTGPPGKNTHLARPNVCMFSDYTWLSDRTSEQRQRFREYRRELERNKIPSVVIEIGAGHAVPTVRHQSEELASHNSTLIRINPLEPEVPNDHHISLPIKGLEALQSLDDMLQGKLE